MTLYTGVAAALCLSWICLYYRLRRCPGLLEPTVEPAYVRHGIIRTAIGALVYLIVGVLGVLVTPPIAPVAFVVLPAFSFVTREGLPGARDSTRPPVIANGP